MFSGKRPAKPKVEPPPRETHTHGHQPHSHTHPHSDGVDEPNTLPKEVISLMDEIRLAWDFMSDEDFNPVPHALALLESSSSVADIKRFYSTYDKLENAMDVIVNGTIKLKPPSYAYSNTLNIQSQKKDYHEAFNRAIQTFSSVVEYISDSRRKVDDMRADLELCRDLLQCKRFDLLHLWVKSIQYKEMSRILDVMEDLRKVPDKIDALLNSKLFLSAVRLLTSALRTINSDDCSEIGALENIRSRLEELHSSLHETLIDELHNHLYLKSPFSLDRIGKRYDGDFGQDETNVEENENQDQENEAMLSSLTNRFADKEIDDNFDVNPETDSYRYMGTLLECLAILGKLPEAVEGKTLDGTLLYRRADYTGNRPKLNKGLVTSSMYNILEVWFSVQNEVKALLYDYLTNSEQDAIFASTVLSVNEMLKEKKGRGKVKSHKQLFKIAGGSGEQSDVLKDYKKINGVGKIASLEKGTSATEEEQVGTTVSGIVDKYATVVTSGHRLLVTPDSYNVLIAYKPTVAFVEKIDKLLSRKTGNFTIFLDDFILNVFLPQMEDRVLQYFVNYVAGPDAYVTELSTDIAAHPLAKSAIALIVLIQAMCRTLFTMPVQQAEFVRMVEMVLVKYYERVLSRYRELMSGGNRLDYDGVGIISAGWACEDEIVQLLLQNTYLQGGVPDFEFNRSLAEKETYVEMRLKKERSFYRNELIFEPRKLLSIAQMHYSLDWFIFQISMLRVPEKTIRRVPPLLAPANEGGGSSSSVDDYLKLSTDSLPNMQAVADEDVQLPLDMEMSARFDSILNYYQELSETYLFALRVELRCHAMYYLDLALREGNYWLEDELFEPDPYRINKPGISKLLRNVQALQQNLTNFVAVQDHGLERVKEYFSLLHLSGAELLEYMARHPNSHTFEEFKVILDLIYQEHVLAEPGMKKAYNEDLDKMKNYFVTHHFKGILDLLCQEHVHGEPGMQKAYNES
ncbi:hypothetical protein HDU76_011603 [Blyttiomyces sp. JEL0837]|nr:hypothetical protein HDU76_011603 [Blyttiomyces sp. JEL0837]